MNAPICWMCPGAHVRPPGSVDSFCCEKLLRLIGGVFSAPRWSPPLHTHSSILYYGGDTFYDSPLTTASRHLQPVTVFCHQQPSEHPFGDYFRCKKNVNVEHDADFVIISDTRKCVNGGGGYKSPHLVTLSPTVQHPFSLNILGCSAVVLRKSDKNSFFCVFSAVPV